MRVFVLYFGVLKDVMGHGSAEMQMAEGASVAELLALHRAGTNAASSVWDSIAVAVNQEYARAGVVLKDGDEVALLPPVSGGWDRKAYPRGLKPPVFGRGLEAKAEALAYLEARTKSKGKDEAKAKTKSKSEIQIRGF